LDFRAGKSREKKTDNKTTSGLEVEKEVILVINMNIFVYDDTTKSVKWGWVRAGGVGE
jgi:hypothetical protein